MKTYKVGTLATTPQSRALVLTKAEEKQIVLAVDKIEACAEVMIETPLHMIKCILMKHEKAVLEVMKELHERAKAAEAKCAALEADAARKVSGGPNVNWLMKPSLDWLENAEHGENQARCRMIAGMLRDLWRGNDTLGAMPVAIGGEKK